MNNKGFSTIELLVSFLIISFVAIAMYKTVLDLLDKVNYYQDAAKTTVLNGNIINSIQKDLNHKKFYGIDVCGCNCYDITYQDLSVRRLKVDTTKGTIQYGGITETVPEGSSISGNLQITTQTFTVPEGKNNTIVKISIPIDDLNNNKAADISVIYQYDDRDRSGLPVYTPKTIPGSSATCYVDINNHALFSGMTM